MGKVKTVRIDAKGNLVEVDSKPEVILFDIETNTIKNKSLKKDQAKVVRQAEVLIKAEKSNG